VKSSPSRSRLVQEASRIQVADRVDILLRPSDANAIVAVEIILPMGSREESPDQAGITTLALRMLTRGTKRKSDAEIATDLESIGASFTTNVQKDRAAIGIQTTLPQLSRTFDLVEELLTESCFPAEPFEIEKAILSQEIREELDSPPNAAGRLFQRTLFDGHPYGHPGTGTPETVESLSRDRVKNYFESRFGRGKASVGVVGKVDREEIGNRLEKVLEFYGTGESPETRTAPPAPVRPPDSVKQVYETRATEAECIVYGYPAPNLHDPDYMAVRVLNSILGGSMDSRLFSEIREKQGLVYQIGSSFPALEWQGMFAITLISTRQNHDRVLEGLAKEIHRAGTTTPSADELKRAITYLQGTFLMSQERNADQATLMARYHSLGLGIEFIEEYPGMLEKVTPRQVQEVAQRYLLEPTIAIDGPGE